jgi:diguanylate cyclase (GGDEF)-like protein
MATAGFVLLASALAARYGAVAGTEVKPFLPIAATLWSLAETLTAFLLFARFFFTGRLSLGIIGAAYELCALLTWPYLFAFPGLFRTEALPLGDQQVFLYIWSAWHLLFPLMVALGLMVDPASSRGQIVRSRPLLTGLMIAGTAAGAVLLSGALYAGRSALIPIVAAGQTLPTFAYVGVPAIAFANVLAGIYIWRRVRLPDIVRAAIILSLFAQTCDALLNASTARFSSAWYLGKIDSVVTTSVVAFVLLIDVVNLYRRLSDVAAVDVLTGLANRRTFNEHFTWTLDHTRRRAANIAVLMIDIDHFKKLNDRFGHSAGDECLRAVGAVLQSSLARAQDLVARYGGEEFVVVLSDTPLEGVLLVAERIRAGVAALDVRHEGIALGKITISVGSAFSAASTFDAHELFDAADRAMYDAKQRGRDRVVLRELREDDLGIPEMLKSA